MRAKNKLVCGVGMNDADYAVATIVNGVRVICPAYMAWNNMLKRAYSAKLHARFPTYRYVTVCGRWLSFMAFREWWLENQVAGYHLDKDLIGSGKIYSPETCVYVPSWLNTFVINQESSRGECLIGVHLLKRVGKYQVYCGHPLGNREHLGYFSTEKEAHAAWLSRKLAIALELKTKMDQIDVRIYPGVVGIIKASR